MTRKLQVGLLVPIVALTLGALAPLVRPSGAQTTSGCSVSSSDQAVDAEEQSRICR